MEGLPVEITVFWICWVTSNILLILSGFFFYIFNVATRKYNIPKVLCICGSHYVSIARHWYIYIYIHIHIKSHIWFPLMEVLCKDSRTYVANFCSLIWTIPSPVPTWWRVPIQREPCFLLCYKSLLFWPVSWLLYRASQFRNFSI